ncbi:MAG: hypothetical protein QW035_01335 [Candidatus Anstonellales archaeon]
MKRSKGTLSKRTRRLGRKKKVTPAKVIKEFSVGDRVVVMLDPSSTSNPAPRYHGKAGRIVERRGEAYVVEVMDFSMPKKLIVLPLNLKKVK